MSNSLIRSWETSLRVGEVGEFSELILESIVMPERSLASTVVIN